VKEIKLSEVATASVKVNIEASEKIENLKVAITSNSPAFTAAVVGFAGLDVANPGLLGGALTELGLKNGDAVKGQTELEFDITPFVPMIFGVMMDASETEATADFALTVVDTKGNSKTETVKLKLTVDVNPAAE
jgi:hypothetical protein